MARSLDESDLSVQQIADELRVSRNTVSNYLHGRTTPTWLVLRAWADLTGVDPEWLMGDFNIRRTTQGYEWIAWIDDMHDPPCSN